MQPADPEARRFAVNSAVRSVPSSGGFPASVARSQIFPVNGLAAACEPVATAGAAAPTSKVAGTAPTTKTCSHFRTHASSFPSSVRGRDTSGEGTARPPRVYNR